MKAEFLPSVLASLAGLASAALQIDVGSPDSIKKGLKTIARDTLKYYSGDEPGRVPGILPGPPPDGSYYWWEGGALWGTLIDYWHFTGDATYNDVVTRAMMFQTGPPGNAYMPENWTASLGNDDQGFWGLSAMLAAETKFPDPPKDKPQWLALAQAVFNTQAAPERHDIQCGGGLHWQIFIANTGYNYKNTISNGIFFNLGARLARYTNNNTYAEWAVKTWDWIHNVGLIDEEWNVFDGARTNDNCTVKDKVQFSYNAGILMQGAAFMYNYTNGSDLWKQRIDSLLTRSFDFFFPNGIIVERSCETEGNLLCGTDQLSFKGYFHRWLATVPQLAPYTSGRIWPVLKASAAAAAKVCTGGESGTECGFRWTGPFDGSVGAGQQMNVLGALSSLLLSFPDLNIAAPVTNNTGGTSVGNPNAGSEAMPIRGPAPITAGDRVGAGILTTLVLAGILTGAWMLSSDFGEP